MGENLQNTRCKSKRIEKERRAEREEKDYEAKRRLECAVVTGLLE